MDINKVRKHCGFYRKETYIEGVSLDFCDMRHLRYSTLYPDFKPIRDGKCFVENECPMIRFLDGIKIKS